jgi:hypothetical protein
MSTKNLAVSFEKWAGAPETAVLGDWVLTATYPGEDSAATGLVDLSHRPKALVSGPDADGLMPLDPGRAAWDGTAYQAARKSGEQMLFDLTGPLEPAWPGPGYTDMTDAWVLLAVFGPRAAEVIQRMAAIDFDPPQVSGPFYAVTRSHGLWIQLINLRRKSPGFLVAVERAQGQNLAAGLVHAGHAVGMKVMGFKAFDAWFLGSGR